jgi:integrase/recombinase XerD
VRDVERLEEEAPSLRDRLLIRILFRCGPLVSEALRLRVEDVDFVGGGLRIEEVKTRVELACARCGGRLARSHAFCPGCGARAVRPRVTERALRRSRVVPLDAGTLELLREYVERGGPVLRDGELFLFEIARGRVRQIVRECARRARLRPLVDPDTGKRREVTPQRLREAFAVMQLRRDGSRNGARRLRRLMGHSRMAATMRYRRLAG